MSESANDPANPDFSDSDQKWYAALTGQTPPADAATPAAREGVALRLALEQRRQEIDASPELAAVTAPEAMRRQLERLQQRIDREGVFDRAPPVAVPSPAPASDTTNVIEFPWWRQRRVLLAVAASVLVAVVAVPQLLGGADYPLPSQMAGADGLQATRAPQPRQVAERLANQLRQAGLRPGLYQRGKTYVVDITLMSSDLAAAGPGFAALGLAPAVGFNRVEISPP